ncbi:MAG: ketol-acid reductoisomerase [Gammaproteobacteria bacterium]|nr:ketol-acid reductoisomerase [Gammaproteobacteria bacterium]MDH3507428.1 ketol-acid reductoisomerase [Gammaproteobacteria bacterium]
MKLFVEADVQPEVLAGERIAVLGYGSQGRAHAMNLRDSGFDVVIGLRPGGKTTAKAENDGFQVLPPDQAVDGAGLIAFLAPDMVQASLYEAIESKLKANATLLFAHGFNIHYGRIEPRDDLDVVLIAPKGPGDLVRRQYEAGRGVPCLMAVAQDVTGNAKARALAYAHGIGGTRGGVLETTFGEETETDLFGEQAVLCGGLSELIVRGFQTLVDAGYQPEVAYFECMHEVKLIVDLLHEGGLAKMHEFVSETAKYGDLTQGPRVVDEHTGERMKQVLKEIQDGTFANNWVAEYESGLPEYTRLMEEDLRSQIETVGKELRGRMAWLRE